MSTHALSRRQFLVYTGAGAAGFATASALGPLAQAAELLPNGSKTMLAHAVMAAQRAGLRPGPYPLPLALDGIEPSSEAAAYATFTIEDDVRLGRGLEYYLIAQWGDPVADSRFGYNADFTALIPVVSFFNKSDLLLWVNHEYVSGLIWQQSFQEALGVALPSVALDASNRLVINGVAMAGNSVDIDDPSLTADQRQAIVEFSRQALVDHGGSIIRVRPDATGKLVRVPGAAEERRITSISGLDNPAERLLATGPAAAVFARFDDDNLGAEIIGMNGNCSGGTTPWGTVLTCEENFQGFVSEDVRPNGRALPPSSLKFGLSARNAATGLSDSITGLGNPFKLLGNKYGWIVEIDPASPTSRVVKHTALGRFRHENVAMRAEEGKPLAVYMGDDRRGGHVWKFVSSGVYRQRNGKARNSELLHQGTLYAARFNADFTGQWIPLVASTPVNPIRPSNLAGAPGRIRLPKRTNPIDVAVDGGTTQFSTDASVDAFVTAFPTLASLYPGLTPEEVQGAILVDAFPAANAVGATPTARPEDVEVHPIDKSVYIAFTDHAPGGDGSPDKRIFPDSAGTNSRQYGSIMRLAESNDNPVGTTFTWGRFVNSGEPFEGGGGFAAADNLLFDANGNMFVVCDISTEVINQPVTRTGSTAPGTDAFRGIFGSNALWLIPTSGPNAGVPICLGYGPNECEMTGPSFTPAGDQLVLSIQHPGEANGIRGRVAAPTVTRQFSLMTTTGQPFTQTRSVPLGSNWPSKQLNVAPRPAVIGVRMTGGLVGLAKDEE